MVAFEQTHYLQVFSGAKSKFQFNHLEKVKLSEKIPKQYGYLQKKAKNFKSDYVCNFDQTKLFTCIFG